MKRIIAILLGAIGLGNLAFYLLERKLKWAWRLGRDGKQRCLSLRAGIFFTSCRSDL